MLYCGQELINGNFATAFLPPPQIYYAGPPRNLSPPWRPDDKDGHYVFALGENLTPRCTFICLHWSLFIDSFYLPLAALGDVSFGEVSVAFNVTILDTRISSLLFWLCIIVSSSN
jgi:hypothetical protein